jgi:hypothetical protein
MLFQLRVRTNVSFPVAGILGALRRNDITIGHFTGNHLLRAVLIPVLNLRNIGWPVMPQSACSHQAQNTQHQNQTGTDGGGIQPYPRRAAF